jgi:acyl-CoA thioester hydrolase
MLNMVYSKIIEIRWSDLDPNFHVRHSVYYDLGAYVRMCFLTENGLTPAVLLQHHLGPILFREECLFKQEIQFGDKVSINVFLKKASRNYSRWTMQHEIYINAEITSAIITVDGAWMDTAKRKLTVPLELATPVFEQLPKAKDFEWFQRKG